MSRGPMPGARAVLVVLAAASVTALAAGLLAATGFSTGFRPVADAFGVLATALFFGAGTLRYARWRVTGEAYIGANSAALLVFALATLPMAMAVRPFGDATTVTVLSSLARFAAALVVAAIFGQALRTVEIDSRLRPRQIAVRGLIAAVGAFVVMVGLALIGDAPLLSSLAVSSALELLSAGIWLASAALCARAAWERRSASVVWTSAVLAMLGAAAIMRAASRSGGVSWQVAAALLTAVAASAAVVNASADIQETLAGESDELLTTSGALADAERLILDVEARREELVHDAGSMIGALRAASTTLGRHAEELDAGTTRQLRTAMDVELERLGHLIEGPRPRPVGSFEVASALEHVIAVLQNEGLGIDNQLDRRAAVGRPDDLSDVVHNLIVNARRHAPGSRVVVRCATVGHTVRIYVEDRGPGVAAGLLPRVFERGVTCSPGVGHGLGLHVARRVMRDQGGDLELMQRPGGGTSAVASLPASASGSSAVEPARPGQAVEQSIKPGGAENLSRELDAVDVHPGRDAGVVRQHHNDTGVAEPQASRTDECDVGRVRRPAVGADDDAVAMAGLGERERVGEQSGPHGDHRPTRLVTAPPGHGDEPVTLGAGAPRLS